MSTPDLSGAPTYSETASPEIASPASGFSENAVEAVVRHVLFGPGELPEASAEALADRFAADLDEVEVELRRGSWGWSASVVAPESERRRAVVTEIAAAHGCGHAVVTGRLATTPPRLIVTDVDSTLVRTEAIDLLADAAGVGPQVAAITERTMRGELDYRESLAERVSTLAGLPESVFGEAMGRVVLSAGARELVDAAHALGATFGVVSGGFVPLVQPLVDDLGIDRSAANELEVIDGRLTGRTTGVIVDREHKATVLRAWADELKVPLELTVAVGDGANDLDVLAAAGLGIAYCAKPVTAKQADAAIDFPRLDAVLALLAHPTDQKE